MTGPTLRDARSDRRGPERIAGGYQTDAGRRYPWTADDAADMTPARDHSSNLPLLDGILPPRYTVPSGRHFPLSWDEYEKGPFFFHGRRGGGESGLATAS